MPKIVDRNLKLSGDDHEPKHIFEPMELLLNREEPMPRTFATRIGKSPLKILLPALPKGRTNPLAAVAIVKIHSTFELNVQNPIPRWLAKS